MSAPSHNNHKRLHAVSRGIHGLLYLVGSCFWFVLYWVDVIDERFPSPDDDAVSDWFSRISTVIAIGLLVAAYVLYPQAQHITFSDTVNQMVKTSLSPENILRNTALIAGLFVLVAVTLRISWRDWVMPLLYAIHPLAVALVSFWLLTYIPHPWSNEPHESWQVWLWWPVAWSFAMAFLAGMYTIYRIIRYRFSAHLAHPALTQIMELALAERALTVALEGKTAILYLPEVPVKLITLGLPALAVVFFAVKAILAERGFLREYGRTFHKPWVGLWRQLTARRATLSARWHAIWVFQFSHVARFWTSIAVVTVVMVVAATYGWF